MKRIICISLILLLFASVSSALDLEVYGGKVLAARNYGLNTSENPQFRAGIAVGQDFMWQKLKLYTSADTLMDARTTDGYAKGVDGFHPTSIKYTAGAELDLYAGVGLRIEHMCWHALGSGSWYGADTQQYTSAEVFYRFKDIIK